MYRRTVALVSLWLGLLCLSLTWAQGEKRVTIELKDAPIADAFDNLFRAAGENFMLVPGMPREQRLTMRLTDVPFDKALNFLCDLAGLRWERKDGVYVISPKEPIPHIGLIGGPALPPSLPVPVPPVSGLTMFSPVPTSPAISPSLGFSIPAWPSEFVRTYLATPIFCPRCKTVIRRECPKCKNLMPLEWKFCPFDGTKLPPPPEKCPNCGAPLYKLPTAKPKPAE